jgi:DnaJ-domain-containing protein 1
MVSSGWKKAIGAGLGYCVAGPVGALLGFIIGRQVKDSEKEQEEALMVRCCRALEVDPAASPEEIKKSYRRLVKRYHPDLQGPMDGREAEVMQSKISSLNEAYGIVKKIRGF